jgi:hypothetical protein
VSLFDFWSSACPLSAMGLYDKLGGCVRQKAVSKRSLARRETNLEQENLEQENLEQEKTDKRNLTRDSWRQNIRRQENTRRQENPSSMHFAQTIARDN